MEDGCVSKERLNEIKDSVNFQKEFLLAHNMNTLCVDEEQELIEEIDRLNNIINKLEEYCWELKAMGCREGALDMLDKIEELKNGDNNE